MLLPTPLPHALRGAVSFSTGGYDEMQMVFRVNSTRRADRCRLCRAAFHLSTCEQRFSARRKHYYLTAIFFDLTNSVLYTNFWLHNGH